MSTTAEQTNREILESFFEGGTFKSPESEYAYRTEDFVARIPQTGETFDRDSLLQMQKAFGQPPSVELERITGEGDLWVVEAISTYEDDGDYYVCLIVEFVDGKVRRETRYYGPPLEVDRS